MQQLVAVEYRRIPALEVLMTAGQKLLIVNPFIRRGMLLLQPENVVVLGGMVRIAKTVAATATASAAFVATAPEVQGGADHSHVCSTEHSQ